MFTVSGSDLYLWRQVAIEKAIANEIDIQEVDWLLQEVTNLDSLALRLESFQNLSQVAVAYSLVELTQLWQQRTDNYLPVQYLVGKSNWRNWQLAVSPAVLIPRPETELIVEIVQKAMQSGELKLDSRSHLVDLGTGSGAIAIALADSFPQTQVHGVDLSREALVIAKQNAATAQLTDNITFYQGSWWNPLAHLQDKVSAMVANPPYIPSAELPKLQPEVFRHEPHLALDGGTDGLDAIRHLVKTAPQYLKSEGLWLIELMAGQASAVMDLLSLQGDYHSIRAVKDLAQIERFVLAFRN